MLEHRQELEHRHNAGGCLTSGFTPQGKMQVLEDAG